MINNGIITLTPKDNKFTIKFPISGHAESRFNFELFVIITIISCFGMFLLTNYLADFKTIQGKSRIDIIFLTIFFILLFIPMSRINRDEISVNENRTLTNWKPLITENGKLNYNFGKDYNDWFNDRFNYRKKLISLYDYIRSINNNTIRNNGAIYYKNTKWMFQTQHRNTIDINKQRKIIKNLNLFNNFCKENGIKLYLFVIPLQDEIYNEKLQHRIMKRNHGIENIAKNLSFPTIFPYNELKKASVNKMVYYKTDWHWTDDGAFIGYLLLMGELKKDYPNLKILTKEDFNITKSNKVRSDWDRKFHNGEIMMFYFPNLKEKDVLDIPYDYYENKDKKNLSETVIDIPYKKEKNYTYPKGNNLKLLQIGTSMNESLLQFTPYSFKSLKYIRIQNIKDKPPKENYKFMKYYKKEILDFKPDIMIFCVTIDNLRNVGKIFDTD